MRIPFDDAAFAATKIRKICAAVQEEGGRAFLVGGYVRDRIMSELRIITGDLGSARDFDVEVYNIDGDRLRNLLSRIGRVNAVGEAFTVYKLSFGREEGRVEIDVSLPRRESKTGYGHRGFTVAGDPYMTMEEAARRRDFTINALMLDPITGDITDTFGGIEDIRAGLLRVIDPATFVEDSLRVLRAAVFAARFEFEIEEKTVQLCKTMPLDDLPSERIWGEIEKLLLRARRPSIGLQAALELGVVDQLFPELKSLVGCPQEPEWHPEGDVWVHTLQVADEAAKLVSDLSKAQKLTVMLAAIFHDLGKPQTTEIAEGRVRSFGHEEAGVAPAERMLDKLNIHTIDGYDVREQVKALVANHLKPGQFYKSRERLTDGAFRRLARKCELELLYRTAAADSLGRHAEGAPEPNAEAQEWFRARAYELGVERKAPSPILMGRHILELGIEPGPFVGEIARAVYEMQLDGKVTNIEEAAEAATHLIESRKN